MDPGSDGVDAQQSTTPPNVTTLKHVFKQVPRIDRLGRNTPQNPKASTLTPSAKDGGSEIIANEQSADTCTLTPLVFQASTTNDTDSSVNLFLSSTENILRSIKRGGPTPRRFIKTYQRRKALKASTTSVPSISSLPSRGGPSTESVTCELDNNETGDNPLPLNQNGQADNMCSVTPIAQNMARASDSQEKSLQESLRPSRSREECLQPSAEVMEIDTSFGSPRLPQGEDNSSDEDEKAASK
jgi:hypothetical protein